MHCVGGQLYREGEGVGERRRSRGGVGLLLRVARGVGHNKQSMTGPRPRQGQHRGQLTLSVT
jgi:hypothetical protein